MNLNENYLITISRQFGTGGHEIGEVLAERLGARFIDRKILGAGVDERHPADNVPSAAPHVLTTRRLFDAGRLVIKEIVAQESCVLIGCAGFDIFSDHPNKLRIFLHSPLPFRIARIMMRYKVDETQARYLIQDNDYRREVFTKTFTGKDWYDVRNYDLGIDAGGFGVNGAVDFVMHFIGA